ncbi:hypothetical protein M2101_001960 [Parabacteroides sp. PM5-20]|uniref:porin n=1 Tax=unclassified Parabacteroides TaxID=2649774 RepID=UPI0013D75FC3|nr:MULTISPECIES: porin [unclassified Parabacteroides]MDH6535278.1 hypothetical protein [Parabacteroides sp. PM5-20]
MKRFHLFIGICLFGIPIYAQHKDSETILQRIIWDDKMLNIMVDTRVDYQMDGEKDKLEDAFFHGHTLKLWVAGEIIPGIRYRIRHRLNKPQTPLREGFSGATDHAWIAFDAGKRWTFTIGKQSVQLGTFEYDYNPADIYLPTMVYNDFDGYKLGLNVAYHFLGQTLNVQFVNSDAPQFASEEYKNKSLGINTLWEGNLFNGLLKTRWGYGAFQHKKTKFYNWITAGTQVNVGKITAELDYYYGNRNMDYGADVNDTDLGTRYVNDQSAAVNIKYNAGKWKPFIKGTWDQRRDKVYASNAYETLGIQAAVEFYPFTNQYIKDLRFHVLYGYSSMNFQGHFSLQDTKNKHTALIGTRWLFKAK